MKPIESSKPRRLDFPDGSILFDVRYYRKPSECFEILYWDPCTKRLELKYEPAIIDIWFLKPDCRTNKYQISQANMDDCYVFYCKPSQVGKVIAQEIGGEWMDIYNSLMSYNDMTDSDINRKMCECPWVFKADFEPASYYRLRWIQKHGIRGIDVTKVAPAFLDIETDVLDRGIDPRDYTTAPQPINAVTLIIPHVKIAALFVLAPRPKEKLHPKFHELLDKQIEEYNWMMSHMEQFKHDLVYEDEENVKYVEGFDIRVHVFDFDKEIHMIQTIFAYVAKYRPWFLLSWNAPFDDNYLMNRIRYLGYDPCDIMIPPEFKTKKIHFSEDKSKDAVIKTSKDWFDISSYPVMMCQMRLFAAIRKSQQERRSYQLDVVAREMAGVGKSTHFDRKLAYEHFLDFLKYNFRDVIAQVAVEEATHDCRTLVSRSYMFATQYSKCFQETHIVRNIREYFYEKECNYVQACRMLIDKSIDGAFKGAFVADPAKNNITGLVLNGKKTNNIIYGPLDADAESYYPNSKMATNQDQMTLLYKMRINNDEFRTGRCTNRSMNQEYIWYDSKNKPHEEDMSGPLMNSYKNGNILSVMRNWFNAPAITEVFMFLDSIYGN